MPSLTIRLSIVAPVLAAALAGLSVPCSSASSAVVSERPSIAELDRRIAAAARRLEVVVEQYNQSRDDLSTTVAQQRTLGSRIGPMTVELRQRQQLIGDLAGQTYKRTVRGPAVALFGSDNPHEFVGRLLILEQLATEQQRALTELIAAQQRVDEIRNMLTLLAGRQRRTQQQLTNKKAVVEGEIAALKQMRDVAYGGGSRYARVFDFPTPPYVPGRAGRVVAFAYAQLGKPYSWGAAGPRSYDCSGLTLAAWESTGVGLPHNAARQYDTTVHVSRADARPGDLVFFYGRISHVGVYIGDGMMIHAPEFGENVRIAPIDSQPIHGFGRPSPG